MDQTWVILRFCEKLFRSCSALSGGFKRFVGHCSGNAKIPKNSAAYSQSRRATNCATPHFVPVHYTLSDSVLSRK